ncbi:Velvet factor [Macrophomina phaseolina MS6]|uniref:Velvet factor n=1 Tax=Macrophomina phaseolina (strain MS6) TaxID=1126212 RepID=K2QXI7_MACPH|nr:Velvet factor [Macrophomina phaseolina MS6]
MNTQALYGAIPPPTQPGAYAPADPGSLAPMNGTRDSKRFRLVVEQQPVRARMCGFGDKDRRPITPPPCIRLIVEDQHTGKEIPFEEVDSTFFVLTVDLWSSDARQEVNLVRASSGAPTVSISTSTLTSYPPHIERGWQDPGPYSLLSQRGGGYSTGPPPGYPMNAAPPPHMPPQMSGYHSQTGYHPGASPITPQMPQYPGQYGAPPPGHQPYPVAPQALPVMPPSAPATSSATGMFTRNLIGSLSVNAFRLNDTSGKTGFWFVLQDLSVRTEGVFRLKMNFVDVGKHMGNGNNLNTGKAPVLASCFSDAFQVYSAKKFPGVIESTPLSKCFAAQGIKIPIRKDGPKPANAAEYENDDQ